MKKTFKKLLSILMVFCMVMGMMPVQAFAATHPYLTKAPQNITLAPGESKGVSVTFSQRVRGGTDWGNADINRMENGGDSIITFGANAGTEVTPYTFVYNSEKAGTTETYWLRYTCTDGDGNNLPQEKVSFTVTYLKENTSLKKTPDNITLAPGESKGVSVIFTQRVIGGTDWGNADINRMENGGDSIITFGANAGTEVTPYTFVYNSEKAGTTETYWLRFTCTDEDGNKLPQEKVSFTVTYEKPVLLTKAPENITLAPGESKGVSVTFAQRVIGETDWGNADINRMENGGDSIITFGANAGTEVTPYTFVYDAEKAGTTETYWLRYTCTGTDSKHFPSEKVSFTVTYLENAPSVSTTSITVVKEWDVPEGTVLPESVEVYLLANGQEVTDSRTILDEGNNWTYTWTELPVNNETDGKEIVYTVDEVEVEDYEKTIGEAVETDTGIEIAITNSLKATQPEVPATTSVTVVKEWNVPEGTNIPVFIEVYLLANGQQVGDTPVRLTADADWTYTFENLPIANEEGKAIEYTVAEVEIEGFESTVGEAIETDTGIEIAIINSLKETEPEAPATTSVTVVKEWNVPEGTNIPVFIEVYLLANGQQVGDTPVRLTADADWTYTFENQPIANEEGKAIEYTVAEVEIEGFESTVGEAIETDTGIEIAITNSLKETEPEAPETVTVAGTKTWVGDEENYETVRPDRIIVNLIVNDEVIDETEATRETQWTYSFGDLPKYDEAGNEIEYTVQEEEVDGYTASYDGFNITNTLNDEDDKEDEDEEGGNGGATTPTTPSAPSTPSVPDTSDNTNTLMYLTSLICAAAALVAVVIYRRKKAE